MPRIPPGAHVSAVYDGVAWGGSVAFQQDNGAYAVNWDDGSHSYDVPPDALRMLGQYKLG